MDAAEKALNVVHQRDKAVKNGRSVLIFLVFLGFVISGIVEHGVTVALSPSDLALKIFTFDTGKNAGSAEEGRKYCDPPNMTALAIYYDSSEETNVEDDYYFSQLQEMNFQANLSQPEKMELSLKKFFLWGTFFSPIPASRLAVNIGPKKVFGYSLLGAAASTLLVPAAWLTSVHVVIRFVQGLFCGALIPSVHSLAITWFPLCHRSSFVSLYSAKYLGYALCELFTIKVVNTFGPSSIYYMTSILTVLWFVPWSIMVFNTPAKHLKYAGCEKPPITLVCAKPIASDFPLKNFICSRPVWMSAGAIVGVYSSQITINVGMRLYLKYVYGISDGFLSAIPFLMHVVFALSCGFIVNYIQRVRFVSVTSSRRMFVYISHFIPAGLLFIMGYVGCGSLAPIILYSMAITASGAAYAGAFGSTLDIAPNYAGTVMAFCCTFGNAAAIFTTYLIAYVLNGEVLGSWRFTFSLTSLILLVSSIFFMLRGSGTTQFWNDNRRNDGSESSTVGAQTSYYHSNFAVVEALPTKGRAKSIYSVEQKILKVLHVQEPDKFTRVRAYSTSLSNGDRDQVNVFKPVSKKRASIT